MTIPVVLVDDEEVDRYLVKRRLARAQVFNEVTEVASGDILLEQFFNGHPSQCDSSQPLLVLMDVNMPGRNGFETAEEMQQRMADDRGPKSVVVMMFTSSDNPNDRAQVEALELVKGYILKPIDSNSIEYIRKIYQQHNN